MDRGTSALRKLEGIFHFDALGTLWLGQGAMVSDSISERDFSGTTVAACSAVGDSAGGQIFRFSGGGFSGVAIGSAFKSHDGLGRAVRARHDTPLFNGFGLRASVGRDYVGDKDDTMRDVAAVCSGDVETVSLNAGVAWSRPDGKRDRVNGSIAALHKPTGFSAAFAAGADERPGASDGVFVYGKLGWKTDGLTDLGATAFSIDDHHGDDIAAVASDSDSFGLAAVQKLKDHQTELYATVRWHRYDDAAASCKDGVAFLTGARFRF